MRKAIVMMLLAVVSGSAAAEWVKIGSSPSLGGYDHYVDPATIRKSGDIVKMWGMYDFKTTRVVSDVRYLSEKLQIEHDCKNERSQLLFFSMHAGNMGNGDPVYYTKSVPDNWTPISPGSVDETQWKFACGKR